MGVKKHSDRNTNSVINRVREICVLLHNTALCKNDISECIDLVEKGTYHSGQYHH